MNEHHTILPISLFNIQSAVSYSVRRRVYIYISFTLAWEYFQEYQYIEEQDVIVEITGRNDRRDWEGEASKKNVVRTE